MLDLATVVMEATFERGDCCFRWGSEQQEQLLQSESDPVSLQMILINKGLWKDMQAVTLMRLC